MVDSNLKLDSSTLQYFCHLLESGLARINWIRAVDKFCVEQLISYQLIVEQLNFEQFTPTRKFLHLLHYII